MSDLFEYEEEAELVPGDWPVPFTMVPVWLLLAGCTAQAYRMYAFLVAHIQQHQARGDTQRIVCPKQVAIAHVLGLRNRRQVGPYARELVKVGALSMEEYRYANGMRRGYRYRIHFNPPSGHIGPTSLSDFYGVNRDLKFAPTPGRVNAAAAADTSGGTENSTTGGTENGTAHGPTDGPAHGPMGRTAHGPRARTAHGPTDDAAHGPTGGPPHRPTDGPAHGSENRSPELDVEEVDVEEAETPPPPPSVATAEDARAQAREEGAAAPHDLSAGEPGGTATPQPALADLEPRYVAMARDVVARLPRLLQPGDQTERAIILDVIAARLAEGYPVPEIYRELSTNLPDQVASRPKFIAARLRKMAPWLPPARSPADRAALDRAAVDEIQSRQAQQAGTPVPTSAAAARAEYEAARARGRTHQTQQQNEVGGTAES